VAGFNFVDKFNRLSLGRDDIKPPSRDHQASGNSKNAICNGIAMVMIIEEPRVHIAFTQDSLYGWKVHRQTTILNNCAVLSESC
jgi:hypothetical protein